MNLGSLRYRCSLCRQRAHMGLHCVRDIRLLRLLMMLMQTYTYI